MADLKKDDRLAPLLEGNPPPPSLVHPVTPSIGNIPPPYNPPNLQAGQKIQDGKSTGLDQTLNPGSAGPAGIPCMPSDRSMKTGLVASIARKFRSREGHFVFASSRKKAKTDAWADEEEITDELPLLQRFIQLIKGPKVTSDANGFRIVTALGEVKTSNLGYASNVVRTTSYNWLSRYIPEPFSFLFQNLFLLQFRRLSNVYYLFVAAMQFLWWWSPYAPMNWLPLLLILLVNMVKELYEDYYRGLQDCTFNDAPTQKLTASGFKDVVWRDIKVGDVVRVRDNQPIPADLVVAACSEGTGEFYVSTADLDGETNLKSSTALESVHASVSPLLEAGKYEEVHRLFSSVSVTIDPPNIDLSKVAAFWKWHPTGADLCCEAAKASVVRDNCGLRGTVLKNTDWLCGLVVYAGHESKVYMNLRMKLTPKVTSMEGELNNCVKGAFVALAVMCLVASVTGATLEATAFFPSFTQPWYLFYFENDPNYSTNGVIPEYRRGSFLKFLTDLIGGLVIWLILLAALIPISLTVTLEIVRIVHKLFIDYDTGMIHEKPDGTLINAEARTSNLSEELGRVQYVFSDKTGTLTCNALEVMKLAISPGIEYGCGVTEIHRLQLEAKGVYVAPDPLPDGVVLDPGNAFYDVRVSETRNRLVQPNRAEVERFFEILTVCHTVVPRLITEEDSRGSVDRIKYQAESPDEAALVLAAKSVSFVLKSRTMDRVVIEVDGEERVYHILEVNQFNSTRKRMSVVARCPDGSLRLFCKGADSHIIAKLATRAENDWQLKAEKILTKFSRDGLRTLCMAHRELDEKWYEDWHSRYVNVATAALTSQEKDLKMDELAEEIEDQLIMVGCSGIEDKLQDKVPTTIKMLLKADIKVWILTGDKVDTAISIGMACGLVTSDATTVIVSASSDEPPKLAKAAVVDQLRNAIATVDELPGKRCCLVIDSCALHYARELEKEAGTAPGAFLEFALRCATVLCCRVSPKQKAQVVELVKVKLPGCVTLSIGDGANDVAMIKKAHIGVGISGMEGRQAINASDYSIGQFKYIANLLLVHGRLNCLRISFLIYYSFYKNIAFALTNLWYGAFNLFSGSKFQEDTHAMMWNVVVTSFPILFHAMFDKDLDPHEVALRYPVVYKRGHPTVKGISATGVPRFGYRGDFSFPMFALWMLEGLVHSVIFLVFPIFCLNYVGPNYQPGSSDLWTASFISYTCCVVGINLRILWNTGSFNFFTWFGVIGSIIVFWFFTLIYHRFSVEQMSAVQGVVAFIGMYYEWAANFNFYLIIIVTVATVQIPVVVYRFWTEQFSKKLDPVIQLRERIIIAREIYLRRKGVRNLVRVAGVCCYRPYSAEELFDYLMSSDLEKDPRLEGYDFSGIPGLRAGQEMLGAEMILHPEGLESEEEEEATAMRVVTRDRHAQSYRGFSFAQEANNCPSVPICVAEAPESPAGSPANLLDTVQEGLGKLIPDSVATLLNPKPRGGKHVSAGSPSPSFMGSFSAKR